MGTKLSRQWLSHLMVLESNLTTVAVGIAEIII